MQKSAYKLGLLSTHCTKVQLISKSFFGIFNPSKKTNEKIRPKYYGTSSRIVLVRFLEEFEDTKKTFQN